MRKGLLSLGAVAVTAALALAGCSGPSAGSAPGGGATADVNEDGTVNNPESVKTDPDKLVLWSLFSGGDGAWMDKIVEEYNATNPKKQVQSVMLVWADYYTKLTTAVATGNGPDIGISHMSKLPELVAKDVVVPIDDYTSAAGTDWSEYPKASQDGVSFDGQHYAIPLDTHAEIMYFNNDLIQKAGIQLDANGQLPVASSDDLLGILKQLKDSVGADVSPLALPQQGDDPYRVWWATYFQMGGAPLVSSDGTKITMDRATAVKAADFLKGLYDDGYVLPGIEDHQKLFQQGQAAIMFGGTWATGAFEQSDGLSFTPQNFPALFGGSDAAWADSHTLIIPANPKRSDEDTQAAVDFINWVASQGGLTWAGSGQIPANSQVTSNQAYLDMPFRSSYMHEKDVAVLPSSNEHFYALKDTIIKNLDTIWAGQSDSGTAIDNMIAEMGSDLQ
ncbi:extracellular solute-binding protein [Xylanimonas protaetiae]|uniref:Extracellular solute-binding protein n=1 Tax=Xylanimonas protaetiae TaxID=2509457 RepID=A0A4P6F501_9MICO|nr:extracellular solute-binding protein [Xylanimonas protaetiae]QAY70762.1 extracellular solute-binding protein [Xylanimonas protaetiae]